MLLMFEKKPKIIYNKLRQNKHDASYFIQKKL